LSLRIIFMAVVWLVLVGSRLAVVLLLLLLWPLWRPPLLLLLGRILMLSRLDWLLWLLGIRGPPRARICRFWCLLLRR
jgi:hypothetical protein